MIQLGSLEAKQDHVQTGLEYFRKAMVILEKSLGPEHVRLEDGLLRFSKLCEQYDQDDEAESLMLRVLAIRERRIGSDQPEVAQLHLSIAAFEADHDRFSTADSHYIRALEIYERVYGPESEKVVSILEKYASFLLDANREEDAERVRARAKTIREKILPPELIFLPLGGSTASAWSHLERFHCCDPRQSETAATTRIRLYIMRRV
jgi:hypothetical protein